MFDFRYHALSLAAVLLALAVGVLIGVAIGDSNLVSSAKDGIVANLDSEVSGSRRQAGELQEKLGAEEAFAGALYPLAVHGLLSGRDVGLVFLGPSSNTVAGIVRAAATQAGGNVTLVAAVREPLDVGAIARGVSGTRFAALNGSPALIERFGELAGRELVAGGPTVERELLGRARDALLNAFDGQLGHLRGLVVAREQPGGMSGEQRAAAGALETGLLNGVAAAGVPVVGVELTGAQPSQIAWYRGRRVPSVDDLDGPAGPAALIYALAGARGAFGVKPTADSLLPSAVP